MRVAKEHGGGAMQFEPVDEALIPLLIALGEDEPGATAVLADWLEERGHPAAYFVRGCGKPWPVAEIVRRCVPGWLWSVVQGPEAGESGARYDRRLCRSLAAVELDADEALLLAAALDSAEVRKQPEAYWLEPWSLDFVSKGRLLARFLDIAPPWLQHHFCCDLGELLAGQVQHEEHRRLVLGALTAKRRWIAGKASAAELTAAWEFMGLVPEDDDCFPDEDAASSAEPTDGEENSDSASSPPSFPYEWQAYAARQAASLDFYWPGYGAGTPLLKATCESVMRQGGPGQRLWQTQHAAELLRTAVAPVGVVDRGKAVGLDEAGFSVRRRELLRRRIGRRVLRVLWSYLGAPAAIALGATIVVVCFVVFVPVGVIGAVIELILGIVRRLVPARRLGDARADGPPGASSAG